MKGFVLILPIIIALLVAVTDAKSTEGSIQSPAGTQYTDIYIDSLLIAEKHQDDKEAVLSSLIESTADSATLANLFCRRGRIRITHTHLPKGIEDMHACLDALLILPDQNSLEIQTIKQELTFAKKKLVRTNTLASNKDEILIVRFTALWKLGARAQAVALVKAKATPEVFSTMSTSRMVNTQYLCEGSGPEGPEKSFRTRKAGPFWWCDELAKNRR